MSWSQIIRKDTQFFNFLKLEKQKQKTPPTKESGQIQYITDFICCTYSPHDPKILNKIKTYNHKKKEREREETYVFGLGHELRGDIVHQNTERELDLTHPNHKLRDLCYKPTKKSKENKLK